MRKSDVEDYCYAFFTFIYTVLLIVGIVWLIVLAYKPILFLLTLTAVMLFIFDILED